MTNVWFIPLALIAVFIAINGILGGLVEYVYPAAILSFSLMLLVALGAGSISQAKSMDGLENLPDPGWGSIYGAWLYVNDRREWMKHLLAVTSVIGIVFGALIGFLVCFEMRNQSASLTSLFLGILLTLSLARAYFEYWDRQEEDRISVQKGPLP